MERRVYVTSDAQKFVIVWVCDEKFSRHLVIECGHESCDGVTDNHKGLFRGKTKAAVSRYTNVSFKPTNFQGFQIVGSEVLGQGFAK